METRPSLNAPLPVHPKRRLPWTPILLVILTVCLVYFSFHWAIGAVIHSRPVVMVPDINGKSVSDALNQLSQMHLGLTKEGEQFDKRFPAGTIIRQSPTAGMVV